MRIIFYVPSVAFGGGESYIFNLLKETKESYYCEIRILTACKELYFLLKELDFDVVLIKTSPSLGFKMLLGIVRLNLEIVKFRPSIVFLNGLPEAGALARYIFLHNGKKVSICHSNEYWLRYCDGISFKRLFRKLVSLNFLKYLDKVIVITNEALTSLEGQRTFKCKVKKIHNGIPKVEISKKSKDNSKIVFGRISRLCDGKGNEMLLEATAELINKGLKLKLIIAGTGEQLDFLKNMSVKLGIEPDVDFIGHVSPSEFFSKIDCMISPSDLEALPTVISEAMSCFIPVISTSVGGVPEMINHKVSGYLIEAKNKKMLIEAMQCYLLNADDFDGYANHAFDVFKDNFSIKTSTKKTWEFINE
ncbi:TPA: glycosyltransferase family 4 protein [Vibrio vulnificus]|nr:glycosyltransferase family 4 protein [Vibrio vulnificus]HDY8136889.1 glycosyltransferase family 4 protein [Vibrio vulnificus]HDY8150412.1 glycosyltransferase family 4 protein [Vibrio vulnificus]HDY8153861.1 glycosyltransferase family 4 protein [Vibrio vulnificus]